LLGVPVVVNLMDDFGDQLRPSIGSCMCRGDLLLSDGYARMLEEELDKEY
jgi:hypothetical protein